MSINSENKGNLLRFVNDLEDYNVEAFMAPIPKGINGRWKVFYKTTKDIEPDEELSISYGISYWKNK